MHSGSHIPSECVMSDEMALISIFDIQQSFTAFVAKYASHAWQLQTLHAALCIYLMLWPFMSIAESNEQSNYDANFHPLCCVQMFVRLKVNID